MNLIKKFKVYIILIVLILILSGVNYYQKKAIDRKNLKIERLTGNVDQLLNENADYTTLNLTLKEAFKGTSLQIDSLTRLLKIKPKTVERIVYKTVIQHDTVPKLIPVVQKTDTSWTFTDVENCFEYKGLVTLKNDLLKVKRLDFLYTNKMVDTFFWYRKFPLIGKKYYTQKTVATCGNAFTKDVTITKR